MRLAIRASAPIFIIYGIAHYLIEFFRPDPGRGELFGFMSGAQGIAIAGGLLWVRKVPQRQTTNLSRSAGVC